MKNTWHALEFAQSAFHARSDARQLWARTTDLYLLIEKIDSAVKHHYSEPLDRDILTIVQNALNSSNRTIDELARRCLNLGDREDITAFSRFSRPIYFTLSAKSIQKFEQQLQTHIMSMQIAFVLLDRGEKQQLTRKVTDLLSKIDTSISHTKSTSSMPNEGLSESIQTSDELAELSTPVSISPRSLSLDEDQGLGSPICLLTSEEIDAWREIYEHAPCPTLKRTKTNSASSMALIEAVKQGSIDEISQLLNSSVDVNGTDKRSYTALHMAVKHNNLAAAKLLLAHGASIATSQPTTPLLLAIQTDRASFVELFLASQPTTDLNAVDTAGWTLLHHAVHHASSPALRILLQIAQAQSLALDLNARCNLSWTPLMHLGERAHVPTNLSLATLLLDHNAEINATDAYGYTALYYAVTTGAATTQRDKFVSLLVQQGADCEAVRTKVPKRVVERFGALRKERRDSVCSGAEAGPRARSGNRFGGREVRNDGSR